MLTFHWSGGTHADILLPGFRIPGNGDSVELAYARYTADETLRMQLNEFVSAGQVTLDSAGDGESFPLYTAEEVEEMLRGGAQKTTTDAVVLFQHGGSAPAQPPIVALDLDANTVTVAGNHAEAVNVMALVPNGAGITIAGSTGNDGEFIPSGATYDAETNRTTITINPEVDGAPTDPTVDGTVQFSITYLAEIAIPPNGSVEWVSIETTEAWSGSFYGVVGDDDDPEGFCAQTSVEGGPGGADVGSLGFWQWPINTLRAASSTPGRLVGNYDGIKQYPEGGTVRIVWSEQPSGEAGSTTITVHHHFTEAITATRITG